MQEAIAAELRASQVPGLVPRLPIEGFRGLRVLGGLGFRDLGFRVYSG